MKRLFGYITVVFSFLLALMVGLVPSLKAVNGTGDYESMKTYVYKISEKTFDISNGGTTDDGDLSEEDQQDRIDTVVDEFKTRLANADISDYKLETSGYDTIKVTFKTNSSLYSDISSYLSFSWSLMASTYDGSVTAGQTPSEIYSNGGEDNFFESGSAKIEYKNSYPYVTVKLSDPDQFKTIYKAANSAEAPSDTDDINSEEDEEKATADQNKIFILNNWVDGLTISDLLTNQGNNYVTSSQIKNHILFALEATSYSNIYWDYNSEETEDNQDDAAWETIYFGGYNINSLYYGNSESDRVLAYKKANIWMNKFNSNPYECNVTLVNVNGDFTYENNVSPFVDFLVYMNEINWSNGLYVSCLIGLIVVSLFLILNYGINGVTSILTSLSMFIVSIGLFNTFGSEFNLGAIIGLLTLVTVSLFSSGIYFKKIKDEIYLGKNIKKAFNDGSKKSFATQIDFSVVSLILGITAYLIPNSMLVSFGSLLIVGSLLNVLLNVILLRCLSWLIFNSSVISNKLNLIAVDKKRIPDLTKDEKPTYFKQFEKKTSKNVKKTSLIISSILLLASIVGMTSFYLIRGNIYNNVNEVSGSEIVIRYDKRNVSDDDSREIDRYINDIEDVLLERFYVNETTTLFKDEVDMKTYNYSYLNNKVTNKEYYFVIELNDTYNSDSSIYIKNSDNEIVTMNFVEALDTYVLPVFSRSGEVTINEIYNVNNDTNNYYVLLFVSIGIGVTTIYMLFRFNLSKTIVSILIGGSGVTITIGLFSLINVSFASSITLGGLYLVVFAYLLFITIFNKEKEVYKDNKNELQDLSRRKEIYEYSLNSYYNTMILNNSLISCFMIISLFFTNGLSQYLLILMLIGVFVYLVLIMTLSISLEIYFSTNFIKIKENARKKHEAKLVNKKKNKKKDDYEGPEEAIFIGIND